MSQQGVLEDQSSGNPDIETLTGDTGGAVGPDGAFNINILGGDTTTVTGDPGSNTLTIDSSSAGYPITPYVVGTSGEAGYTTIQDGLDAANTAGGGDVYVQRGAYTEDLTLYDQVNLIGVPGISQGTDEGVTITGTHAPPTTGHMLINGIVLFDTTAIFGSDVAGSSHLTVANCQSGIENGYLFSLPNWTGTIEIYNHNPFADGAPFSINDGGVNNSGGAVVIVYNSRVGNGTNTMNINGVDSIFEQAVGVGCPVNLGTGANLLSVGSQYLDTLTLSGNSIITSRNDDFETGSDAAIIMNSTSNCSFANVAINSTNAPAIDGTGSGTLQLTGIDFINDTTISTSLTLSFGTSMTGTFETGNASSGLQISGSDIDADGTDTNIDITITPKATAAVIVPTFLTVGTSTASTLDELHVEGAALIDHTSTSDDDHALEIDCNAAGFGDVKALDVVYATGAMATGDDEEVILANIDESASSGGVVSGYEVLSTAEGSASVYGYVTGININPILHNAGTFGDIDSILNIAVDVTAALASGGAGNITTFVADNDTMTFGDAAKWNEMEFILDTPSSGAGIAPTFEFSTGGAGFTAFTPADGTNGFRNSGAILWVEADLVGWATNASGFFEIRITRTRNSLSTVPIMDEVQLSSTTEFIWDSSGDVNINSLTLATPLTVANGGTGAATLTDGGILLGSGTSAITATAQPASGELLIGSSGVDPVLATLTAGAGITITEGAGSITIAANDGGLTWTEVTGTTQAISVDNGYIASNAGLVTLTLPATAAIGDVVKVDGKGAGGWLIAQNAGQTVHFLGQDTTTGVGGSLASSNQYDCVTYRCITANTDWVVEAAVGNLTVV